MTSTLTRIAALLLCVAALPLATACGDESSDDGTDGALPSIEIIDVATLNERRDADPGLQIVDVRTAEEVAAGTIPGSTHIPHDVIAAGNSEGLDLDEPIAVICRSGRRAAIAGEALADEGASDVQVVSPGGVTTWADAGYPVVVP
jgi:rhodanese-related sulfurtransferase